MHSHVSIVMCKILHFTWQALSCLPTVTRIWWYMSVRFYVAVLYFLVSVTSRPVSNLLVTVSDPSGSNTFADILNIECLALTSTMILLCSIHSIINSDTSADYTFSCFILLSGQMLIIVQMVCISSKRCWIVSVEMTNSKFLSTAWSQLFPVVLHTLNCFYLLLQSVLQPLSYRVRWWRQECDIWLYHKHVST